MAKHSAKYQLVKSFFDRGLWSEARVRNAVGLWITEKESQQILEENK